MGFENEVEQSFGFGIDGKTAPHGAQGSIAPAARCASADRCGGRIPEPPRSSIACVQVLLLVAQKQLSLDIVRGNISNLADDHVGIFLAHATWGHGIYRGKNLANLAGRSLATC